MGEQGIGMTGSNQPALRLSGISKSYGNVRALENLSFDVAAGRFFVLFGPSSVTDGSQNLVGALRTAMGVCGAFNIREMHKAEMVIAPAITTEGKSWQMAQG